MEADWTTSVVLCPLPPPATSGPLLPAGGRQALYNAAVAMGTTDGKGWNLLPLEPSPWLSLVCSVLGGLRVT